MWTGRNTAGKPNEHNDISLLGKNARFKGAIMFEGTARIDGRLEGDISTEGVLVIGEHAVVEGNIVARTVHCAGTVTGDIVASERIELVPPAFVMGRVTTPRLSLREGVSFLGTSDVHSPSLATSAQSSATESNETSTMRTTDSQGPYKKLIPWNTPNNPTSPAVPGKMALGE